jgi:hypothetical protein
MTTLTEKSMLVSFNISTWRARITDRTVTAEVEQAHGAERGMGRFSKRLIAKERLETIDTIAAKARNHHYTNTLPWLDNGARILPAASYFDYTAKQNAYIEQFDRAVADFVTVYPVMLDEAKRKLGRLFKADDYPSPSAIGDKFKMTLAVSPLPEAEDFRVKLGDDEEARIRQAIEARLGEAAQGCVQDAWQRIHGVVERMVDRLKSYSVDKDGKVQNTFRDSLVENVRELADILPALNVTNNNALAEVRDRLVSELCAIDAPVLREDAKTRRAVAKKAEAILKDVSDFMA